MVTRVLCSFCSYGCELGIEDNDFGIKGVEYLRDTPNEGRLCPRGSAAARYLDHPMRLTTPYKNGYRNWHTMQKELKRALEDPASLAVTIDRNITKEEYEAVASFCEQMGIEHFASTYFEPESLLETFFDADNPFSLDEIPPSEIILVMGDLFNQSPMISKHLIKWKLSSRKNRLIVIDFLKSHTAYFANDFVRVKPGTEPLLFYALSGEKISGLDLSEITGVPRSVVSNIAQAFKESNNGLIMACLAFSHTHDPVLLVDSMARFGKSVQKKIVPFVEFKGFRGSCAFGSVLDQVKKRKIRNILNFGELFPFHYPQVAKELSRSTIYASTTLNFKNHALLPFALNLEKSGSIITTFGLRKNNGDITPASGAKNAVEILQMLGYEPRESPVYKTSDSKIDITERAKMIAEKCVPLKKKKYRLFGEKIAYNFMTIFENDSLKISPDDADRLGARNGDLIIVESKHGTAELAANISPAVGPGIVVTTAESPVAKGLFEYEFIHDFLYFVPTEVEIWLKE